MSKPLDMERFNKVIDAAAEVMRKKGIKLDPGQLEDISALVFNTQPVIIEVMELPGKLHALARGMEHIDETTSLMFEMGSVYASIAGCVMGVSKHSTIKIEELREVMADDKLWLDMRDATLKLIDTTIRSGHDIDEHKEVLDG